MSGSDYKRLIYKLGKEISDDPEIELDELKYICKDKIPHGRLEEITDVFSWLEELETSGNLGIDNLEYLKEVLQTLEKHSCLEKVVAFEAKHRSAALAIQISRNPGLSRAVIEARDEADNLIDPAGATGSASFGAVSTVKQSAGKLLGVLDIKCIFYSLAGTSVLTSATLYTLKHCQENPALVAAFTACALPTGVKLIELSKGCVCLTVQAESLSALKALWERYEGGSLQTSLQNLLVTDEIKEMVEGQDVQLRISIDKDSYRNACMDLLILENGAQTELRGVKSVSIKRRMSDSFLTVKSADDTKLSPQDRLRLQRAEMMATAEAKRRELLEKELEKFTQRQREENEFKQYKGNEYVSEYLEKLELGSSSGATESGYRTPGSSVVDPSELETESERYDPGECRLEHLPGELLWRVCTGFTNDITTMEVILEVLGLPVAFMSTTRQSVSSRHKKRWRQSMMFGILRKYPATPVRFIRDVCSSLLDGESLVQSLDEAILSHKPPPALRLVRPLEEIRRMYDERIKKQPVTYIQRAQVLVIGDDLVEYKSDELVSFFKDLDPICEAIKIPFTRSSADYVRRLENNEKAFQSLRHHEDSFSFYFIFVVHPRILHLIRGLKDFLYNCSQIKIIVTTKGSPVHDFPETVILYNHRALYPLSSKRIASIFKQHWRNEDIWSMLKRYRNDYHGVILSSSLTSKVMFKESTQP